MLKKQILSLKEQRIVTLDPYAKRAFSYAKSKISHTDITRYDRNSFYISYVQTKDIISSTVDISRGVSDEDLHEAIEIKAYDELGLESSVEYSIFYFESNKKEGEERVFNVIVVDRSKLIDIFDNVPSIRYIDYITAAPFLFKSLYTRNVLELGSTDCFVYFHKEDAFVAIYQDGEYIFSKSIRFSLQTISENFSKELGKHIDDEEFYAMLQKSGMQNENGSYQQQLMKLFSEGFVYINDVVQYAKRAYHLEKIDRIFLGSEIGDIAGMVEFCHNYLNIPSQKFDFKLAKNANEITIDPIQNLMILTAQEYQNAPDDALNFSIFKKPPSLSKRPSGRLIQVVAASLLLSLAYPTYQYVYDHFFLQQKLQALRSEQANLSVRVNQTKAAVARLSKEHKDIETKLAAKEKDLAFRTKLLREIYHKKVSYPMKAKVLTKLFEKVNRHHAKVVKVENVNDDMILTIQSVKDKYITEFIKDLADQGRYHVSTDLIKKDENGSLYESAVKVGLNAYLK